jgi:Mrp family chromosome partitioning ATPase
MAALSDWRRAGLESRMASEAEVRRALGTVMDPELHRSIMDLGMVRDLVVEAGRVSFTLALTTLACPMKDSIVQDAQQTVRRLPGVADVQIAMVEMTAEERQELAAKLQGQQAEEQPLAAQFNHIDKVIAVMSGKGGVGKSSVASMLAVTLHRRGFRVGVLDGDITGPSIPRMFDVSTPPSGSPLGIVPGQTRSGIRVISINLLLPNEDDAVIWRGPLISGAIKQFWADVFWGDLDFLVLDLPPGTSDASLTVLQSIPLSGILLVTSPQGLAGMVVRKSAQMAEKLSVPILGLVENMSYVTCPHCGTRTDVFGPSQAEQTAAMLGVPLLGRLPLDADLAVRCDSGRVEEQPTELFEPIVDQLLARVPEVKCTPAFSQAESHA